VLGSHKFNLKPVIMKNLILLFAVMAILASCAKSQQTCSVYLFGYNAEKIYVRNASNELMEYTWSSIDDAMKIRIREYTAKADSYGKGGYESPAGNGEFIVILTDDQLLWINLTETDSRISINKLWLEGRPNFPDTPNGSAKN